MADVRRRCALTQMKALLILLLLGCAIRSIAADLTSTDAYRDFVNRKDYEGGVSAFEREIAAHPTDVRLLFGLGQLHYSFVKYSEAKAAFERLLSIDPSHTFTHNFLGILLSQQGRATAALKHLDLAIKADPAYADAYFNRAVILATNQPPDKIAAKESYKRAISLGCEPDYELEKLLK